VSNRFCHARGQVAAAGRPAPALRLIPLDACLAGRAEYPIALVKFSTKINKFDENQLTKIQ
jgi:hypothetical protein